VHKTKLDGTISVSSGCQVQDLAYADDGYILAMSEKAPG